MTRQASDALISSASRPATVREAGKIVQVGMGAPNPQIPLGAWAAKQAEYIGSFRYGAGAWTTAIHLVASGRVELGPLITHRASWRRPHKG